LERKVLLISASVSVLMFSVVAGARFVNLTGQIPCTTHDRMREMYLQAVVPNHPYSFDPLFGEPYTVLR
jgi:hypothetical protein